MSCRPGLENLDMADPILKGTYFVDRLFGSDRLRTKAFDPEGFLAEETKALADYKNRIAPYRLYAKKA